MTIFHCVCVGGIQVGESVQSVEEAERAMSLLAGDGVDGRTLSVETWEQDNDGTVVGAAAPYYLNGRWHDAHPLPRAA